jgi:hypothetical protein
MDVTERIADAVVDIFKRKGEVAISVIDYLGSNTIDSLINVEQIAGTIDKLVDGRLKPDIAAGITNLLCGISQTYPKPTLQQSAKLRKLSAAVRAVKLVSCSHPNSVISVFCHGGGFCGVVHLAELLCSDCGLNVTLHRSNKIDGIEVNYDIVEKFVREAKGYKGRIPWIDSFKGKEGLVKVLKNHPVVHSAVGIVTIKDSGLLDRRCGM